jgi:uncharacterized metal-binding protein YceD (DUF177 family)
MREYEPAKDAAAPWRVPVAVADVAETGEHFDLVADADARAAVARIAGLRDLPRLEANFDVARQRGGVRVAGRVSATVGQTCVVTLEPIANEVAETVDVLFVPQPAGQQAQPDNGEKAQPREAKWGDPEPLVDGAVDLGALAIEFLILGLDPYPRKPGAVFQPPADAKPLDSPFAALATLKKGQDGR